LEQFRRFRKPEPGFRALFLPMERTKIHILDRDSIEELTSFGDGRRQPGEFYAVQFIATDSKGKLFATWTCRGQSVRTFVYKGLAPMAKQDQGVLCPKTAQSSVIIFACRCVGVFGKLTTVRQVECDVAAAAIMLLRRQL
jgi:hypothetical protein